MKRFEESNFYELLEISREATSLEIQSAFHLARKTYRGRNPTTRPLFSDAECEKIWRKMEEAYRVLSDFNRRKRYDQFLDRGADPGDAIGGAMEEPAEAPIPEEVSGSFLRSLREKRGMTLQNLVSQTRIAIGYLTAIEEDQYELLPHEVYLRSYLGDYSRHLKLDVRKVTEGYFRRMRARLIGQSS